MMAMRIAGIAAALVLFLSVCPSFGVERKEQENRILAVKLQKDTSLEELIQLSGYSINDEHVVAFLTDFLSLNPAIKSISSMKKGVMVRVPLMHLKKVGGSAYVFREKTELSALKRKMVHRKHQPGIQDLKALTVDRSMIMKNIRELFAALGQDITYESEGFKYFPLSEKSDFSFDTGHFPVIDLHDKHILVIDYSGSFPEEIKDLLEISWPEYRVVSPQGRFDLRSFVPLLLRESGYALQENGRMVSGGASQVEYLSDYLVYGKSGSPREGDITLVSMMGRDEYRTPQRLLSWFSERDVTIVELADHDRTYVNRRPGDGRVTLPVQGESFAERLVDMAGFPVTRNQKISIASGKEIRYNLQADMVVDLGYRKKIIQFAGITDQEADYAKRLGLDIIQIEPWESRREMIRKILSLFSLNHTSSPRMNASVLTPRNTRYRLLLPGFVVQTRKGTIFLTDSEFDTDFLLNIMNEGISTVRF